MRSFKDAKGRSWDIDVNVFSVEKVLARTGVDLCKIMEDNFSLTTKLLEDMFLRTRVLYVLVEDQAREQCVEPEDFARGFSGDVLTESATCLIRSIADFFDAQKRALMLQLLDKTLEAAKELSDREQKKIDQAMQSLTPSGLLSKLEKKFTAAPASSASTRGRSRSAS